MGHNPYTNTASHNLAEQMTTSHLYYCRKSSFVHANMNKHHNIMYISFTSQNTDSTSVILLSI